MKKLLMMCALLAGTLEGGILNTDKADVRTFAAGSGNPVLTKVEHVLVNLSFNQDMRTISGSIDFGVSGRINVESAPWPKGDSEDPFTIDAYYQELGGGPAGIIMQPNAKIILLFIDPTTVVGSFTAGQKQDFTGSFVLKLK